MSATATATDHPERMMVVWVPDWPLVAAGVGGDEAAAVIAANRVVACTEAARSAGVRRGQRRREAQGRCPSLVVLDHDPERDARRFEVVVQSVTGLTPRVEVGRPGRCAFSTRGPSRYFGGDEELARRMVEVTADALADAVGSIVAVGVADGIFAAEHAARTALERLRGGGPPWWVVAPGATPEYLAPLSLRALGRSELVGVLERLGLITLADLAALPASDVLGRFGTSGLEAHRLSRGLDLRPPDPSPPSADLTVEIELDPPAESVSPAAFAARGLADELHARLAARGSVCTRIVIVAETEHGERSERVWRHEGALTAAAVVDRVRWQLDGWLSANPRQRPTAGIVLLRLQPDEVGPATGRQLGFWGGDSRVADRVARGVARVQGLLGADAVRVPEVAGGREPGQQVVAVSAAGFDPDRGAGAGCPPTSGGGAGPGRPWPGALPEPSPATLHALPVPVDVLDRWGRAVVVDGRSQLSAEPAVLRLGGGAAPVAARAVVSWAGPWPVEERWWDPGRRSRRVRFQVVADDGVARLVVLEGGRWSISATYD